MFKVSCIQLRSNNNIKNNLKKTEFYVLKAIQQRSDLIITPEISSFFFFKKERSFITSRDHEHRYLSKGN